ETTSLVEKFTPLYIQILQELVEAGAEYVQIDEPILVKDLNESEIELFKATYAKIAEAVPSLKIILQTYFESVAAYEDIVKLPVHAIGLDFIHGNALDIIKEKGFPEDKVLAAGVIDG